MHQVWWAVEVHARLYSSPMTDNGLLSLEASDPASAWKVVAVRQALHDLVGRLPERLQQVVVARYGLDGNPLRQA